MIHSRSLHGVKILVGNSISSVFGDPTIPYDPTNPGKTIGRGVAMYETWQVYPVGHVRADTRQQIKK